MSALYNILKRGGLNREAAVQIEALKAEIDALETRVDTLENP